MATTQLAYLLHSRPYQEHKLLLELLTEQEGKISAVIYSGTSQKSNKKGLLQPFAPLHIAVKGKHSLKSITLLEAAAKPLTLTGNFLFSGLYLNELLVRLITEQQSCPQLFNQYQQTLAALVQQQELELNLRRFELSLLDELGLTLDFAPVFDGQAEYFQYHDEQGFVELELNDVTMQTSYFSRVCLQAIAANDFSIAGSLPTLKRLMRQVISPLLGRKPLKSRQLFRKRENN
jgi:DNA repair protein RecO (recombination protein O)